MMVEIAPTTAAYVHIPFCRRRCYYCDFPVSVVGDVARGETSETITHYINCLCQEIRQTPSEGSPLQTVFFGGGTPSLLSVAQLEQVLTTLRQQFGLTAEAEISMELDPGTFTQEHLQGYLAAGVNRISLGVQAFQPELLASCGRSHSVADIHAAIALLHEAQVPNFSLDLISGLPKQTLADWEASLEAALAAQPHHLSLYDLIVEPVTAFGRQYQPGVHPLPSDTLAAEMYRLAQRCLTTAGYEHYEISNYARSGYQCRHNRTYWQNHAFYGFGMGATSYIGGERFARPRKTREYYDWVTSQAQANRIAAPASEQDRWLETLMLGFRLKEGLSLSQLTVQFGEVRVTQLLACLQPQMQRGWVEQVGTDRIRCTDPEGFLFSNIVLSDLFTVFDEP